MRKFFIHFIVIALALIFFPMGLPGGKAEAGVLGRSVTKVAARKAAQRKAAQEAYANRVLKRDALRDEASLAKPLENTITVRRYSSLDQACRERVRGIGPGTHMTSRLQAGRPISAKTAKTRYGLSNKPEARMTVRIPKDQPVKKNKVIGGQAGYGEITSTKAIPPEQIISIKKIQ